MIHVNVIVHVVIIVTTDVMSLLAQPEEPARLASYRRLLRQLPADNRATLSALIGHFYMYVLTHSALQSIWRVESLMVL